MAQRQTKSRTSTNRPASPVWLTHGLGWGGALADLLYPPQCAACQSRDVISRRPIPLCGPCTEALSHERRLPACPTCARRVADFEVDDGRCTACRESRPRVQALVRVAPYGDVVAPLLRSLKYRGRSAWAKPLAGWLAEAIEAAPWRGRVEIVTPVPTHWLHRFNRPLHAAEVLTRNACQQLQLPWAPLLARARAGPHQVGLPATQRQFNVRGAFRLARGVSLHQARVLIIDDVRTTGATLDQCARVLFQAGAAEVYGAVLLRAELGQAGA